MSYRMEEYNYWNDSRVIASLTAKPRQSSDGSYLIYNVGETEEGEAIDIKVPTKFCVCGVCQGRGKVVNPSIDAGGLTSEDLRDWEEGEIESYWSGGYDVQCPACKGQRVEAAPDWDRVSPEDAKIIREWEEDEEDYARTCAMERAMGC